MNIQILGAATTKFGEHWHKSLRDLIREACLETVKDAGIKNDKIEAVYIGNMLSGILSGQEQLGPMVAEELGLRVPAIRIEAACASGGLAMHEAISSIESGKYETVLVVGAEKMTDRPQEMVAMALMAAGSDAERQSGATFPALYALMARAHMEKYGTTEKQLAAVAVKNHYHASLNGKAHYPFPIKSEQVLASSKIADPLKLLDCSGISDGASAVIITSKLKIKNEKLKIRIIACEVATDTLGLAQRESLTQLKATKIAGQKAYQRAGVRPKDIDVAELHDCFTIAEIIALEDLGFYQKGEAGPQVLKGATKLGAKGLITNTSGGLKACGHPVGATGVKQIVEITKQLRGEGEKKQVEGAKVGLCHNVGGTGATAVVTILTN
ncbi:thiolase domain-containing protein [Candidatus Gottesmanbacteria bacterium]|nr:thiolase domain-containing protein [Candidatus Gottesmanbacteria bacterium]